ncbi:Na+/H+ antiporter NhaA [Phreatobacter aquaticus]|uniref:Na(+)/H(+) antiporter NhaA n=1 Tax=Phreatobacter aquaticus TaxID=2570229 RepID=A0A4D7QC93_9HYPH|nr:Na+/H+ antiporter NhaA [Phreatobacter aquaticus]QCK84778.1 Na+/H+ antiporter NhaA [Phreatobacter aquaticus]
MNAAPASRRPQSALRALLTSEAGGGIVLMVAAAVALVIANSPLAPAYFGVLKTYVLGLSILHWINDLLMAVFFLLVGLEIKREFLDGQLSTWPRRILPGLAAAGGMIAPALIFVAFNLATPATLRGWAIPTATDIAFALGVLALIGSRVPVSLKIFLTALAIIDDLGAVAIIAAFYTADLSLAWLGGAVVLIGALAGLNRAGIEKLTPYLVIGAVLWFFVLKSGVHATLAGVALAMTIPLRRSPGAPDDHHSPLHILEHALHPWVAYLIVPIFGFANAGVSLSGISLAALVQPVPLGIAAGLFFGKQIGVFLVTWAAVTFGLADRPEHASWPQVYGVSLLCGIGFTMSLFIGLLAFPTSETLQDQVKIGVLMGSVASALVGTLVLMAARREQRPA